MVALGFLAVLLSGGVGAIANLFDGDQGFSFGDSPERVCVPTLDDGSTPAPVTPVDDEPLPPAATSVQRVRFEVASADSSTARVSVYGDTPESRSCEVSLPWAAEAPIEDAGAVYVTSEAPEAGRSVVCRIYFDDVLVSEALMGESGTYCVGRPANWIGGEATEDGSTGDLVAVAASGVVPPTLPSDATMELQVDAASAATVDVSVVADVGDPVDTGDVPVPARIPVEVPPYTDDVRVYASNYLDEGLIRCRLLVGGVPVSMEVSRGYASCDTSLVDLGLR